MASKILENKFDSSSCCHMLLEAFVYIFKFRCLLPQFGLYISRSEDCLKINPVFLNYKPIIDDKHGIVDSFLKILGLIPLPFEIAVAQNRTKVSQKLI